jgi:hypothetical protein
MSSFIGLLSHKTFIGNESRWNNFFLGSSNVVLSVVLLMGGPFYIDMVNSRKQLSFRELLLLPFFAEQIAIRSGFLSGECNVVCLCLVYS